MSQDQLEILVLVAERLNSREIPYMVSGSMAMNQYAQPRMTRDIDIVIEVSSQDVVTLVEIFSAEFYVDEEAVSDAIKCNGMFNIIHNDSITKIDFIVRKNTDYRATEFARRVNVNIGKHSVSLVSAEDLLLSKLVWAKYSQSEMQLNDVKNLVVSKSDLDWEYLKHWALVLSVDESLNAVMEPTK